VSLVCIFPFVVWDWTLVGEYFVCCFADIDWLGYEWNR
jgi:hypothetical protein